MRPWERWTFHVLSLAVTTSGFAYLWMKYFVQSEDPFALVNHPWQSSMLQVHVLASPPFILVFGIILNSHIMRKLRATGVPHRKSGWVSLATFAAMLSSGYLLQVVGSETWLSRLVAAHVASAGLFTVSYAGHLILSATAVRQRSAVPVREVG